MNSIGNLPYGSNTDDYGGGPAGMEERLSRIGHEFKAMPSLRRIIHADPKHNPTALELVTACPTLITFKDFQRVMVKRRRTVDDLVDIFYGKLDDSRKFFERVMACKAYNPVTDRHEDRSDVVIPYKSVIEFYRQEQHYLKDSEQEQEKLALKRKHKPMSAERRASLITQMAKARVARAKK
jgi:hypothetical protein